MYSTPEELENIETASDQPDFLSHYKIAGKLVHVRRMCETFDVERKDILFTLIMIHSGSRS